MKAPTSPLKTPDGRYIIVKGRLWRTANPGLSDETRQKLVDDLMDARRRVQSANPEATAKARQDVNAAKHALGERGPVWWHDNAPDYNRHMVKNTPYRNWFETTVAP